MAETAEQKQVRQMVWTENKDALLLREILHIQPWVHRHGSTERKQCWDEIAAVLNSLQEPFFQVKTRSVRDRYAVLVKKYKTKINNENKASGISPPEPSEVDEATADIIERFQEADSLREKENADKKTKEAEDVIKAQDLRRQSLETFGETKKRKQESEGEVSQKRAKKFDVTSYLLQKSNNDYELKTKELELKEKEINMQLQQQEQAQKAQQAQMLMMQQQNSAMLELLKMMNNKK